MLTNLGLPEALEGSVEAGEVVPHGEGDGLEGVRVPLQAQLLHPARRSTGRHLELVPDDGGVRQASVDPLVGQVGRHQGPLGVKLDSLVGAVVYSDPPIVPMLLPQIGEFNASTITALVSSCLSLGQFGHERRALRAGPQEGGSLEGDHGPAQMKWEEG